MKFSLVVGCSNPLARTISRIFDFPLGVCRTWLAMSALPADTCSQVRDKGSGGWCNRIIRSCFLAVTAWPVRVLRCFLLSWQLRFLRQRVLTGLVRDFR